MGSPGFGGLTPPPRPRERQRLSDRWTSLCLFFSPRTQLFATWALYSLLPSPPELHACPASLIWLGPCGGLNIYFL